MLRALSQRWIGRRWAWAVLIPVVVVVATGCPPDFGGPPPLISPAPTILSVSVTPTVVAGESITADVVTSHPSATVSEMDIQVNGPGGVVLGRQDETSCYTESFYEPVATFTRIDATTTESTLSCTMPSYATNGTWTATVWVYAQTYKTASATTTFQVVGGTDGPSAPVITMVATPPSTATRGSSFPIEYRIDDVALGPNSVVEPINFIQLASPSGALVGVFNCEDAVTTQLTPTELDIGRTCTVGATLHTGVYKSLLAVTDKLGLQASLNFAVSVT